MAEVQLSRGKVALVDDGDLELVSQYKWQAKPTAHRFDTWYAFRHYDGTTQYLHRLIMGAKNGEHVDHINSDGLDNRRCNLRLCDKSQNMANARISRTLPYRAIHYNQTKDRWQGRIWINHRPVRGPWRVSMAEAAIDRDLLAVKHYGEFAILNFPALAKGVAE